MSDNSAILALPFLQPSQAQKHVTHNEALQRLDVLVQLRVSGFDADTPPTDPAEGDVHALSENPTGLWTGQDQALAVWVNGLWEFITPQPGWRAWGQSENELRIWDGSAWVLPAAAQNNLTGLGTGTTSDVTNRLSVKAGATLLSHDGDDHRLKINKSASTDTASMLFQSGWSGHAEIGLNGNTDFAIKVSGNGSSWTEALKVDATSGEISGAAIQSDATDASAGKLMKTGTFGLGVTEGGPVLANLDDFDTPAGMWAYTSAITGTRPDGATSYGFVLVSRQAITGISQRLINSNNTGMYIRTATSDVWSDWREIVTQNALGAISLNGNEIGGEQKLIADDAVGSFIPPRKGGFALISTNGNNSYPSSPDSAFIWFDVGASLAIEESVAFTTLGSTVDTSTSDVAGTTGADARVTVAVQPGVLKIENRTGSSKTFQVTWL